MKNSLYNLEHLATISINTLRSDLNVFKQYLYQQNLEMDMFTNDLKSKYKIQTSQIHNLVQVTNLILN